MYNVFKNKSLIFLNTDFKRYIKYLNIKLNGMQLYEWAENESNKRHVDFFK